MSSPVRSIKHVVDTNGAVIGSAFAVTDLIDTVDNPVRTSPNNVSSGSRVTSIFLKVEAMLQVGASGVDNFYMILFKNPGANLTAPPVDAVGVNDNRKWVIHQEMIMVGGDITIGNTAAIPRTMFKGVIRIPKPYQRNGLDDKLALVVGHRTGETVQRTDWCAQAIYKEFR